MNRLLNVIVAAIVMTVPLHAQANAISELEVSYTAQGAGPFSTANGEAFWTKNFTDAKTGKARNCSNCHSADLSKSGAHIRTNKVIKPMAPSANAQRYTKIKKIKKWFVRNCKWTVGRECTAQEKGDLLSYLKSL